MQMRTAAEGRRAVRRQSAAAPSQSDAAASAVCFRGSLDRSTYIFACHAERDTKHSAPSILRQPSTCTRDACRRPPALNPLNKCSCSGRLQKTKWLPRQ